MLPRDQRWCSGGRAGGWAVARQPRQLIELSPDLSQSLDVEPMAGHGQRLGLGRERVIGPSECDGEMASVRELDDEVRIDSAADGDDLHSLTREGMMGMGDRGEL